MRALGSRRASAHVPLVVGDAQIVVSVANLLVDVWPVYLHDLVDDPAVRLCLAHDPQYPGTKDTQVVEFGTLFPKVRSTVLAEDIVQRLDKRRAVVSGTCDIREIILHLIGQPMCKCVDQMFATCVR